MSVNKKLLIINTSVFHINDLVEQCQKQNPLAQKKLYEKYFQPMFTLSMRYVKNIEEASEITNDGFLKLFDKISQFKKEGNFEAWMRRIFVNHTIDFIRKNRLQKKMFVSSKDFEMYGTPETLETELQQQQEGIYELALKYFNEEELLQFLYTVPIASRTVFNLYVIENFSHKEIAEKLHISEATSRWHLANARKLLTDTIKREIASKKNINLNNFLWK